MRQASKSEDDFKTYSDLLIGFLKEEGEWAEGILSYSFGEIEAIDQDDDPKIPITPQKKFISTPKHQLNVSMATKADYFGIPPKERL